VYEIAITVSVNHIWPKVSVIGHPSKKRPRFCASAVYRDDLPNNPCFLYVRRSAPRRSKSSGFWGKTGPRRNPFISYEATYPAGATLILLRRHDWRRWQNDQS